MTYFDEKADAIAHAASEARRANREWFIQHRPTSPYGAWVVCSEKGCMWNGGLCVTPDGLVEHA